MEPRRKKKKTLIIHTRKHLTNASGSYEKPKGKLWRERENLWFFISLVMICFFAPKNFKIGDNLISEEKPSASLVFTFMENPWQFSCSNYHLFQHISVPWPEMMKARTHKYSDPIEIITVFKRAWFCCSFCLFLRFSFSRSAEKFSYNFFSFFASDKLNWKFCFFNGTASKVSDVVKIFKLPWKSTSLRRFLKRQLQ